LNFSGVHQNLARAIEKVFAERGKALPINVDGAIGAVISDMGFDWRLGKGFFIISRTVGLVAQAYEELTRERPMRKLGLSDYVYDGPGPRELDG
jgi:citryl-CoA lyase